MQPKTDKEDSSKPSAGRQDPDDSSATESIFGTDLITVSYASDGAPSVDPAECRVPPRAEVTWRGAPGESRPFRIVFLAHSPAGAEQAPKTEAVSRGSQLPALVLDSKLEGERQTCRLTMRQDSGGRSFKYTVEANGGVAEAMLVLEMLAGIPSGIVQP